MREPVTDEAARVGVFVRNLHNRMNLNLSADDLYDLGEAILRITLLLETEDSPPDIEKKLFIAMMRIGHESEQLLEQPQYA